MHAGLRSRPGCSSNLRLSLFGFGIIEVGPLRFDGERTPSTWLENGGGLTQSSGWSTTEELRGALTRNSFRNGVRVLVRLPDLTSLTDDQLAECINQLAPCADGFSVPVPLVLNEQLRDRLGQLRDAGLLLLVCSVSDGADEAAQLATVAAESQCAGVICAGTGWQSIFVERGFDREGRAAGNERTAGASVAGVVRRNSSARRRVKADHRRRFDGAG